LCIAVFLPAHYFAYANSKTNIFRLMPDDPDIDFSNPSINV